MAKFIREDPHALGMSLPGAASAVESGQFPKGLAATHSAYLGHPHNRTVAERTEFGPAPSESVHQLVDGRPGGGPAVAG
jgi:hypothetical protein